MGAYYVDVHPCSATLQVLADRMKSVTDVMLFAPCRVRDGRACMHHPVCVGVHVRPGAIFWSLLGQCTSIQGMSVCPMSSKRMQDRPHKTRRPPSSYASTVMQNGDVHVSASDVNVVLGSQLRDLDVYPALEPNQQVDR